MASTTSTAITSSAVSRAAGELEGMKRSLRGWLKYRTLNDKVIAGTAQTKLPPGIAKKFVQQHRDMVVEQDLAHKLHTLLGELGVVGLPNADLRSNPNGAVQLAQIAVTGGSPVSTLGSVGLTSHPWLWPVVIVGGLLLAVTTAVKTAADVAKERERYACIQAGACTDYGFWLKAGGVTALGWFAWKELGVGELVRGFIKKGRR